MVYVSGDSRSSTSSLSTTSVESARVCRFCLGVEGEVVHTESEHLDEFLDPCPCRGSAKYVHLGCLIQHFKARQEWHNFKCPTCKQTYEGRALRELAKLSFDHMVELHGSGALQVAQSLCYLAQAHSQLGNACESKELLLRGLAIEERLFGTGHIATAATLAELASAYGKLGDVQQQKDLLEQSLAIKEKQFGEGHISTAITLNNLATAHSELGDVPRERELLEQSLRIKEEHFGKNHVQCAATLVNLAGVYNELGDVLKGMELLKHSLAIEEQHFGVGHVETAITLNNLALSYGETGDLDGMRQLLERSLAIKDRHFGADHLESCLTLTNLGMAFGVIGDVESARNCSNRALVACGGRNSQSGRRYGVVLLRVAIVQCALGESSMADDFAGRAFQTLSEVLGPNACKRILALEKGRTSRIWSFSSRDDVIKWLESTLSPNELCALGHAFQCETTKVLSHCGPDLESPRVLKERVDAAITEYILTSQKRMRRSTI